MQKKAQQFGAEFLKKLKCITKKLSGFMKYEKKLNTVRRTGFDLTTYDSYFMILVQVFTNHTLAENTYFTNHLAWTEHTIMVLKTTNKYKIIQESHNFEDILINDFLRHPFLYRAKVL